MKFLYKGVKVSQLQRSFNKFLTRPILWSVYKSFIESSTPICGCFIELSSVKHVWVLILTLGLFWFFFATFVFLEENNLYILFDNAPVEYNILIFFYHYSWFIFVHVYGSWNWATVVHIWSLLTDMQVVSINPLHSGLFHSNYVDWGVTNHINYGFTP